MNDWQRKYFALVNAVTKGSNLKTEHYSAVQADVPDAGDPNTMLNTDLLNKLKDNDLVYIVGQALSHCVANTVRDIANEFGDENIKKLVIIADTTSSVTGFEALGDQFLKEMVARGMNIVHSKDL